MEKYRNGSQQRILRVLFALAGHEVNGLAPGELAKALAIDPSAVTRDLANLHLAGAAEPIQDTGRWRLSPKIPQIGVAMLMQIDKAARRMEEIKQRYTRDPH